MDDRDQIATAALNGMLSNPDYTSKVAAIRGTDENKDMMIVKQAYNFADAMLKARKSTQH